MASESGSAVLEMNDTDVTENGEPPPCGMMEDSEGVPLIMEHGYDIAVKVDSPLKQLSTLETFVTYRVRCVCARWPTPSSVRRRYNHFKALHKRLAAAMPLVAPPPLPPLHSARQQLDRYSAEFVAVRGLALHAFLDRVAKHPILTHNDDFRVFVTAPVDELEKILRTDAPAQPWGLPRGAERPQAGPRVKDPEFTSASEYLTSLQQKLTTLCSLSDKMHRGSAELATDLLSMKRVCDAWSSQAGGLLSRGASAVGHGAGVAGAARGAGGDKRGAGGEMARATLPLLAAYCAAHVDKIRQRDAIHAAYVAGSNATGDIHNRLEQASEALRSELSDWVPKTHSELKSLLINLADRQTNIYTKSLKGWEHALKMSTETDLNELFKTVSKNAVQNLSPSKYNTTPCETERDLEELDKDSNSSDISKELSKSDSKNSDSKNYEVVDNDLKESVEIKSEVHSEDSTSKHYEVVDKNDFLFDGISKELEESKIGVTVDVLDVDDVSNKSINEAKNKNKINNHNGVKSNLTSEVGLVSSDPLREFSDVDLSS